MSRKQARRFNPSPVAQPGYTLCVSQCSKGSQSNHCCSCAETSASSACFHLDSTIQAFTSEGTDHHQSVTISILYRDSASFFSSLLLLHDWNKQKNTASLALACSGTPTHSVCVWTRSADWYIFFFVRDPLSICLWRGFTRGQIWETELLKENTEFLSCVVYCSDAGSERAEPKPAKTHRVEKENVYDNFQAMKDLLVFTNPEVIRAVSGASNKEYSRLLLDHQKHFLLFGFFSSTSSAIFLIFRRLLRH